MSTGTTSSTSRAAAEFLSAGTRLGREFLELLADPGALAAEASSTAERAMSAVGRLSSSCSCGCGRASGCDIPDPCWMPRRLARVKSPACPGATASLRIRVTNCGLGARQVEVSVSGEHAKAVSVSPESATVALARKVWVHGIA